MYSEFEDEECDKGEQLNLIFQGGVFGIFFTLFSKVEIRRVFQSSPILQYFLFPLFAVTDLIRLFYAAKRLWETNNDNFEVWGNFLFELFRFSAITFAVVGIFLGLSLGPLSPAILFSVVMGAAFLKSFISSLYHGIKANEGGYYDELHKNAAFKQATIAITSGVLLAGLVVVLVLNMAGSVALGVGLVAALVGIIGNALVALSCGKTKSLERPREHFIMWPLESDSGNNRNQTLSHRESSPKTTPELKRRRGGYEQVPQQGESKDVKDTVKTLSSTGYYGRQHRDKEVVRIFNLGKTREEKIGETMLYLIGSIDAKNNNMVPMFKSLEQDKLRCKKNLLLGLRSLIIENPGQFLTRHDDKDPYHGLRKDFATFKDELNNLFKETRLSRFSKNHNVRKSNDVRGSFKSFSRYVGDIEDIFLAFKTFSNLIECLDHKNKKSEIKNDSVPIAYPALKKNS